MVTKITKLEGRFPLGQIVVTRGVNERMAEDTSFIAAVLVALKRHAEGDWGDVDKEDQRANDAALVTGERLLSAYIIPGQPKLWVITEWDRSVTTVLFPEEY